MSASDRRGWSYSFFAAAFACGLEASWLYCVKSGIRDIADLSLLMYVTLNALVSARLGGLVASSFGSSDHGFWAGLHTWWIFSLILTVFFFARPLFDPTPNLDPLSPTLSLMGLMIAGVALIFYVSSFIVVPACFIGTALFLLLVRMVGKK